MNLLFWGLTIGIAGKLLVVVSVLQAHSELEHERKVDRLVVRSFHKERLMAVFGLVLMVAGYVMEVVFYGYTPLLTCEGDMCAAALGALFSN